ncbi:MAG: translation elongation factor Ts [Lachnospiraceae bacterium]|nr:translation elongation factor Ts [Lachnospiraceae bacterium]
MAITTAMVKELREKTGAGMMDCKKALNEVAGDMKAAVEALQKKGVAKAAKKATRIAAEGITRVAVTKGNACVVEVNSETDFVAKNEIFRDFVQEVADKALASDLQGGVNGEDVDTLLEETGLKDELIDKTATIGEKLSVRRFAKVNGDMVVCYIHGGGRIGVLVAASGERNDANKEALNNVAMQIAAMNPEYISQSDLTDEEKAKQEEIVKESALNDPFSLPKPILSELINKALEERWSEEDKAIYEEKKSKMNFLPNFLSDDAKNALAEISMNAKEKIYENKIFSGLVNGRVNKRYKEMCLYDQVYVRAEDGKQTVSQYLASVDENLKVTDMVRFEVGEGIEKKEEDFAAEVAAQMNS